MIERLLISGGLGCGTVNNFDIEILKNIKQNNGTRWYFKTPISYTGNGLRESTIDLAFPFVAIPADSSEKAALTRLEAIRLNYENDLICFLRQCRLIVPPGSANFSIIPFWSDEVTNRKALKDFANVRIHILNAKVIVKYRESWINIIDES